MKENITGMMVYYYFVCKRKLWYFCHEITMETENEDVLLGKLLDESSYKKNDKHISIDQIINIDFMKEFGELHEVKKSKSVEEVRSRPCACIYSATSCLPFRLLCQSRSALSMSSCVI